MTASKHSTGEDATSPLRMQMPPTHSMEGLDAVSAIREEFPNIAILVLSAHVEVGRAMELLASGERIGYLSRAG